MTRIITIITVSFISDTENFNFKKIKNIIDAIGIAIIIFKNFLIKDLFMLFLYPQLLCPRDKIASGEVNSLNLSSVRYFFCIKNSFTDKLVISISFAISETLL